MGGNPVTELAFRDLETGCADGSTTSVVQHFVSLLQRALQQN